MSIVFFDTETGGIGIDAARNWSIVQLGAVIWPDSMNQSVFECVINEELAGYPLLLHPEATEITGFTPERIREKGVHPSVAATKFLRWLWEHFPEACAGKEKINLGGHNVGYDTQFLARLFRIAGLIDVYDEIFNYRATDTASIARFLIDSGIVPLQKVDT